MLFVLHFNTRQTDNMRWHNPPHMARLKLWNTAAHGRRVRFSRT